MLPLKLLTFSSLLFISVDAGGRGFPPELRTPGPGPSLRSNATHAHGAKKRFASFEPGKSGRTLLWPDRTISYSTEETKDFLNVRMQMTRAMGLWTSNGLPEDFKVEFIMKSACEAGES